MGVTVGARSSQPPQPQTDQHCLSVFTGMPNASLASGCSSSPCAHGGRCEDKGPGSYACTCPTEPLAYTGLRCELLFDACVGQVCPGNQTCSSSPGSLDFRCDCPPDSLGPGCNASECPPGLSGPACQGPCASQPCQGGGTCILAGDRLMCRCPPGLAGPLCEEDVDECASAPCQNGAICLDGLDGYLCYCVPGFQGAHCEIDIDECASRPCRHNGTCLNQMDHYQCQCPSGYTGANCEAEIDECESDPCQNGGSCFDGIGFYHCACGLGFEGDHCQVDIDECQSQPCAHGGRCQDLVARFRCDCNDTGYEGERCEVEVLECASDPCLHNATCLEGVGHYRCVCWPGYGGEHCEMDEDECAGKPCLHGGLCLERSNQSYYGGALPGFPQDFSYNIAAGFVCQCLPGYAGADCSVDVDECASQPCVNGGHCQDLVDGFRCHCLPGYSGVTCMVDVDECEAAPCQHGATCEDGIADYVCHCTPSREGSPIWGGKNCSVELTGCLYHSCQHGALCAPTYEAGIHSYICHCPPGFHGPTCSIPTTFSLGGGSTVPVDGAGGELGTASISLRFRTTLPDGILFARGDAMECLTLELAEGVLQASLLRNGSVHTVSLRDLMVSNGHWHRVGVLLGDTLELQLWHEGCGQGPCRDICSVGAWIAPTSPTSLRTYIGGVGPDPWAGGLRARLGFVGCLEDVQVDLRPLLPQELSSLQPSLPLQLGCNRTEWCSGQPCAHGGHCHDLWTSFRCDCPRPYQGTTCSQERLAGTFSREGASSFASFRIPTALGPDFNLSFFLRTRQPKGLLFQAHDGSGPRFSVFLASGQVHVEAPAAPRVTLPGFLADGLRHLVTLSFRNSWVLSGLLELGQLEAAVPETDWDLHVGGLPTPARADQWGGSFKGCLQDIQLNQQPLEFSPLVDMGNSTVVKGAYLARTSNLTLGCLSDNTCHPDPCQNGGTCTITWNDFTCRCPVGFMGRSCREKVWCLSRPCPPATTCLEVPAGYICLANATFQGQTVAEYTSNVSASWPLTSLSLGFRTRDEDAVLLWASGPVDSILVALHHATLQVAIHSGNGVEGATFHGRAPVSDGAWHWLALTMEEPASAASRWLVRLDGAPNASLEGAAGTLDFLKDGVTVILARNFTGCLGRVAIGGVDLPFVQPGLRPPPQIEQFLLVNGGDGGLELGCHGSPVCAPSPCLHGGTCHDLFNAFGCSCVAGWVGLQCEVDVDDCASGPCVHGLCVDLVGSYQCHCSPGFIGRDCATNVDDCVRHRCLHGATCLDGVGDYSCQCPAHFTGPRCEWPFPPEECGRNFTCLNGGRCTQGPWGANCSCQAGYAGRRCQININDCDPNPCQNGGTCQDAVNKYKCVCGSSYTGERCDVDKGMLGTFFPFPLIEVAVPVAFGGLLLLVIGLLFAVLTARKRRQSEGTYSPSQQEVAGARLEMDSVLKVPPEERLI
ncbi:protein crumbs homolog 2 [Tachyglossus aculeatus]|uniref:protein crumbs homolog 2 n=1 Tax=Tachyglossus aculeatus TaxID=9261 RepID=UPI0018F7C2C0|nr:protein crumbs homolog 2 [Tachyglossus aculeatus]